jgi:hypothetical protein
MTWSASDSLVPRLVLVAEEDDDDKDDEEVVEAGVRARKISVKETVHWRMVASSPALYTRSAASGLHAQLNTRPS